MNSWGKDASILFLILIRCCSRLVKEGYTTNGILSIMGNIIIRGMPHGTPTHLFYPTKNTNLCKYEEDFWKPEIENGLE